jgi:hypothetical protein
MLVLLLPLTFLYCSASPMPAVCPTEALQAQCGSESCPVSMSNGQHIVFFYNYSSIQLTYVMTGTSQDWIAAYVMDQQNYQLYLAHQGFAFNGPASVSNLGAEGGCRTNAIENTKGIGSVLVLSCQGAFPGGSNCTIWYNQSYTILADRCAPSCIFGMVGNGVCNNVCDLAACGYDGGDCPPPITTQTFLCSTGCTADILGDNTCDSACNNQQCNYDNGDCPVNTNPVPVPTHSKASPTTIATFQIVTPKPNKASSLSVFDF